MKWDTKGARTMLRIPVPDLGNKINYSNGKLDEDFTLAPLHDKNSY